jgi:hypothetical protein
MYYHTCGLTENIKYLLKDASFSHRPENTAENIVTKTKYVMLCETETLMPLRSLLWIASLTSRLRASATTKKIKGDSGQPYINPLENLNNQEGEKFMSTANVTLFKQPEIQLTTEISIPICRKTRLKKVQSTLSYAFDRSNFRMESLRFILLE